MPQEFRRIVLIWSIFVRACDVAIFVLALSLFFVFPTPTDENKLALGALTTSLVVAYFSSLRALLRKPLLKLFIEKSPSVSVSVNPNDTDSWFIRLGIVNVGLSPAKDCIGRVSEIFTDWGTQLKKFDPLALYWARQDSEHTGYSPISIQGFGDFEYLDIAQVRWDDTKPPRLRVVLPKGMTLMYMPEESVSPGTAPVLKPGTYYFRIGIFADDANIEPTWFEITFYDAASKKVPPFEIKQKKPHFKKPPSKA